jgi:hypothetical protein
MKVVVRALAIAVGVLGIASAAPAHKPAAPVKLTKAEMASVTAGDSWKNPAGQKPPGQHPGNNKPPGQTGQPPPGQRGN